MNQSKLLKKQLKILKLRCILSLNTKLTLTISIVGVFCYYYHMNVIMVAEDINKDGSFKQTRGELMCMVSSLAFIKHFYPHFKTTFFVDRFTKEYYKPFGILDLFDEVNDTLLDQKVLIDKNIFWAAGKIMAQRETNGPTLTLDLDFLYIHNFHQ